MDRAELEGLDRESLVRRAEAEGIRSARILTRPELVDELLRRDTSIDRAQLEKKRGFFGRARDLVARVVERGLHLPDAADRIRSLGTLPPSVPRKEPEVVPTVTLAEIYAAQGHKARAIETLRRVLAREPEHGAARALLARLEDAAYVSPPHPLPPEVEGEAEGADARAQDGDASETLEVPTVDRRREAPASAKDAGASHAREGNLPANGVAPAAPEVVAIPMAGGRAYVWWRAQGRTELVLRALVVTPGWDGPRTETRDVVTRSASGELVLDDVPARAIVRVAVGALEGGRFVPLAHSAALEVTPPRPGAPGGQLVEWTLRGLHPVLLEDPRSASIARAWSAARGS